MNKLTEESNQKLKEIFSLLNDRLEVKGGQNMLIVVNCMNRLDEVLKQINTPPESEEGEKKDKEE